MKQLFKFFLLLLIPFNLLSYQPKRIVIIKGAQLPSLIGKQIASTVLYRCQGSKAIEIPFQWDQKKANGDYYYKNGPGIITKFDELLFRLADAGERGTGQCKKEANYEIEVRNKFGQGGFVYLSCCKKISLYDPARDYIKIKNNGLTIITSTFIMDFPPQNQLLPLEYIYTNRKENIHFMDKVKLRARLTFMKFFHISKSEKDFISKWEGYIDGKERGVIGIKNYTKMAFGIPAFPIYSTIEIYPSYVKFPVTIDIPIVPSSFKIQLIDDFKNLYGWKVYSSCSPRPYKVTGIPSNLESYTCDRWKWYALSGPYFTFWTISILPQNFPVKIDLYLNDNQNMSDKDGRFKGEVPGIGWDITSLKKIKNKVKKIKLLIYNVITGPYNKGMENYILEDIMGKLSIRINPAALTK